MFITSLFIIANNWKTPRCPSMDEKLNMPQSIYTMDLTARQE